MSKTKNYYMNDSGKTVFKNPNQWIQDKLDKDPNYHDWLDELNEEKKDVRTKK